MMWMFSKIVSKESFAQPNNMTQTKKQPYKSNWTDTQETSLQIFSQLGSRILTDTQTSIIS